MSSLLIRDLDPKLLAAINYRAAMAGKNQGEWVKEALNWAVYQNPESIQAGNNHEGEVPSHDQGTEEGNRAAVFPHAPPRRGNGGMETASGTGGGGVFEQGTGSAPKAKSSSLKDFKHKYLTDAEYVSLPPSDQLQALREGRYK